MNFMDTIAKELEPILLDGALKAIMTVSPNDAIEGVEKLVLVAASKDMTGKQKAEWVFNKAIEFTWGVLEAFIEYILPLIIKLVYDSVKTKVDAIKIEAQK